MVRVTHRARRYPKVSTGALVDAVGRALDAVTAKDTRGFFGHCGFQESAYFVRSAVVSLRG